MDKQILSIDNHDISVPQNLANDSNFLLFYELKFDNITVAKELGIIKDSNNQKGY